MTPYDEERRTLLQDVASGEVSPADAAERLAAIDARRVAESPPPPPSGAAEGGVSKVRILVAGFPVRVTGDLRVKEAVADGPFVLERDGDTLVITAESDDRRGPFAFAMAGGRRGGWGRHEPWHSPSPLVVRMNPALALSADVTASSFVVRDVLGPISLSVSAGGVRITGFAAPLDLDVTAGSLVASGVLDHGESRLRCSAGSARLSLERGSSVRVRGTASAGRLLLPHGMETAGARRGRSMWTDQQQEAVVGAGAGSLEVEVTTGNVVVRSDV